MTQIELEHFEDPSRHLSSAMCPVEEHLLPGRERRLPGTLSPTQSRVHAEQPLLCRHSQLSQTHRWVTLMPTVSHRCSLSVPLPVMLHHHHIVSKSGGRVTTWTKSGTPCLPPWKGEKESTATTSLRGSSLRQLFHLYFQDATGLPLIRSGVFLWD